MLKALQSNSFRYLRSLIFSSSSSTEFIIPSSRDATVIDSIRTNQRNHSQPPTTAGPGRPYYTAGWWWQPQQHTLTILAFPALLGLFKRKNDDDEDQDTEDKVPLSFKRHFVNAQTSVAEGNYKAAEFHYHKAMERLQRSPFVSSQPYIEAMAVVTYGLGELYMRWEDWDKATNNYIETIRLMLLCDLSMESSPVIELSLKLGKTLSNKNDYQEAEKTFNFTLASAKKLVEADSSQDNLALLGMCYHVKGQYHLMCKDYERAFSCFSDALETAKSVYGENDIQVAVIMNDCATALDGQARYAEAEMMVQEAVKLSLSLSPPHDNEHMATLFLNLATIKSHQRQRSESLDLYRTAAKYADRLSDKTISNEIRRRIKLLGHL